MKYAKGKKMMAVEPAPLKKCITGWARQKISFGDDYDLDHLNELVKADKEGRCVILPVKIGDFVYMPLLGKILRLELIEVSMTNYIPIFKGVHGKLIFLFNEEDIGKDVFLTRKEAEQAMKERENK